MFLRLQNLLEVLGVPSTPRPPHILTVPLEVAVGAQYPVHVPGQIHRHAPLAVLDVAEVRLAVEAALDQPLQRESRSLPLPPQLLAVEVGDADRTVDVLASDHVLTAVTHRAVSAARVADANPLRR